VLDTESTPLFISSKAISCPHCGVSLTFENLEQKHIKKQNNTSAVFYYVVMSIIIFLSVGSYLVIQGEKEIEKIDAKAKSIAEKNFEKDTKIIDYIENHPEKANQAMKLLDQNMSSSQIIEILENNF
jgi:uncharacterized membrane protein